MGLSCIALFATVVSMTVVARASDVDTEHLFGFTTGSDIGGVGETEIESETTGRFGKRSGSYGGASQVFELKYTPANNFRVFGGVGLAYYDISGVPGLDDRRQGLFQGLSLGAAYRLLERETAPFGLSVAAEPHWGRADETSGAPVDSYGVDFTIAADKELVANRIFGAFNLLYQPDAARSRVTGAWQHQSNVGISSALSTQVRPGMFVGAEGRYFRNYDGLGLNSLNGQAFFIGPTLYAKLSAHAWISMAWNMQVAGRATAELASLDLANFERHQVKFRLGINF